MKEYYNKPEATREVIDADGWFHTGDIGVIEDGIVRITDRKKDIIVNAGGKNIAPQNLENALKATPYISQVMVHGDKRPYLVALVTLNEENVGQVGARQRRPLQQRGRPGAVREGADVGAEVHRRSKRQGAELLLDQEVRHPAEPIFRRRPAS